jgi:hypothetical protein
LEILGTAFFEDVETEKEILGSGEILFEDYFGTKRRVGNAFVWSISSLPSSSLLISMRGDWLC